MSYNWQQPDWPHFRFDERSVEEALLTFAEQTGQVTGTLRSLPKEVEMEAIIHTMVMEAVKTSQIEGEQLAEQDVVSSIRNHLGLNATREPVGDARAKGAGELMIDVRQSYADPLTIDKLFEWHRLLMTGNTRIHAGAWRRGEEPMQVISGAWGKENVHFEAPPSARVPEEMERFVHWFNDTAPGGTQEIRKAPIRSAIAHLYFETIHPFEDGNGRIGRAIAEKALSQTLGRPVLLSLSGAIERDKRAYYGALETAQRGNEITPWIHYFVNLVLHAQSGSLAFIDFILKKSRFFHRYGDAMNERQLKVVRRMLETGPAEFEGGMSAGKYISLTKASKATATRDLQQLVELGILAPEGGGRSTRYLLLLDVEEAR